ncbi:hypothetical protein ACE6H2_008498 [Prunus campanulata]
MKTLTTFTFSKSQNQIQPTTFKIQLPKTHFFKPNNIHQRSNLNALQNPPARK